jgi:uncharacterized protein YjbJ (UPF0337 family)
VRWHEGLRGERRSFWSAVVPDWNVTKGEFKQKWTQLTDHDLQFAEGSHYELLGRIQKRTGERKEAVEKAIKSASL